MHKVLIVDDELNMRLVLAAMLKKEGYAITSAADGREALQILKANKMDVVVTDLKMPRLDGMELLHCITEQYPDVMPELPERYRGCLQFDHTKCIVCG